MRTEIEKLCDTLEAEHSLSQKDFLQLLAHTSPDEQKEIGERARQRTDESYGKVIFPRALIELTSYCKNDCYYCGLRRSNEKATRYRLSFDDVLASAKVGYLRGFRTFVLQGGEDLYFTDERLTAIVETLKTTYPDCAITLSMGERSEHSYQTLKKAGVDRYLLRQESIIPEHYGKIHPKTMSLDTRIACLHSLKKLGFQVGTGIMVGSPFQTLEHISHDLRFIAEFRPHMVGIGPFLPHKDTPFKEESKGNLELTLLVLSLLRLMDPNLLLPSTTALSTLHPEGRTRGILAGANVIMPNVSPEDVRKHYNLYDNKVAFGEEILDSTLVELGYSLASERGDNIGNL